MCTRRKGKSPNLKISSHKKIFPVQSELPIPVGLLTGNLVPLMLILITLLPKNSLSFITVSLKITNRVDLLTAVQLALNEVIGAYAIAILDKEHPEEIIAARKSSPLVVGIGEDEFFLASDATPIVEYTDKVVYLPK